MIPGLANPSPQLKGDTWAGWSSVNISPCPVGKVLASVKIEWKDSRGCVAMTRSTADGSVTITDDGSASTEWEYSVDGGLITIAAGDYTFDHQTTDADGAVRTYWRGTHTIQQDITD